MLSVFKTWDKFSCQGLYYLWVLINDEFGRLYLHIYSKNCLCEQEVYFATFTIFFSFVILFGKILIGHGVSVLVQSWWCSTCIFVLNFRAIFGLTRWPEAHCLSEACCYCVFMHAVILLIFCFFGQFCWMLWIVIFPFLDDLMRLILLGL